ncbi:MAG: nucleotidyltransferase domain-containing protein [Anaerolineales bacterium]|jgi:predicted nucleotidyltransferase
MDATSSAKRIRQVTRWAQAEPDLLGVLLVGSYARGTATPSSDLDLVLVVDDPTRYLIETSWANGFGRVKDQGMEDWGLVKSLRVRYVHGVEVEFGLTTRQWLDAPLDAGTRKVLEDGYRILYDRDGSLYRALKGLGICSADLRGPWRQGVGGPSAMEPGQDA